MKELGYLGYIAGIVFIGLGFFAGLDWLGARFCGESVLSDFEVKNGHRCAGVGRIETRGALVVCACPPAASR